MSPKVIESDNVEDLTFSGYKERNQGRRLNAGHSRPYNAQDSKALQYAESRQLTEA